MKTIQTIEGIGLVAILIGGCSADHFAPSAMILCGIGCAVMACGQYLERRWKDEHHRRAGVHRKQDQRA